MGIITDTWIQVEATAIELGREVRIERVLPDGKLFRIEGVVAEVNKQYLTEELTKVSIRFFGWGYSAVDLVETDRVYFIGAVQHHD